MSSIMRRLLSALSSPRPTGYTEGFIPVPGGQIWHSFYRGAGKGMPLVCVHGGPGFPHHYLLPHKELSEFRPVIFYDQLSCGFSNRDGEIPKTGRAEIRTFVDELELVRRHLKLKKMVLLGHSWGSIVAAEYALAFEKNVAGVIFSSPCLSIPRWSEDAKRLFGGLSEQDAVLLAGDSSGLATEEYQQALARYYASHVYRMNPLPEELIQSQRYADMKIYQELWGPNECTVTGRLKTYDCSNRLAELRCPVLYACGRFDEATPESTTYYHQQTPGSSMIVFEESAHLPHLSEKVQYLKVMERYLAGFDARANLV